MLFFTIHNQYIVNFMLLHFVVLFEKKKPISFQLERCYGNFCKIIQIRTLFLMCCYITVSVYRSLFRYLTHPIPLSLSHSVLRSFCVSVICTHYTALLFTFIYLWNAIEKVPSALESRNAYSRAENWKTPRDKAIHI